MVFVKLVRYPHQKPLFGDPCNNCGYCCITEPCPIAQEFLGCTKGPCVALFIEDGAYLCGMVRDPITQIWNASNRDKRALAPSEASAKLGTEIALALGVGKGCDAQDA